ncbi:MAG: hypothetical protein IT184_09655 [Acidobacteria bacterium]|nr:hypothetical protein [Acidobacteriota bacterium]
MAPLFLCLVSGAPDSALALARACSPRVARHAAAVIADVSGCARTIGPPAVIAHEVRALASSHALTVSIGVAPTVTAAWLVAEAHAGATVVAPDAVLRTLAPLPLSTLAPLVDLDPAVARDPAIRTLYDERLALFEQWGLMTLGGVAALPRRDVHARMGAVGVTLHQVASGEDAFQFVPIDEVPPFVAGTTLEWPIDELEPLAFVVARLADEVAASLVRADRGAIVLRTRLRLVTRETHERVLCLPAPIADARVLRTLVLLDLESHPPSAGIDAVDLHVEVMPGRIVLGTLFTPSLPSAEDLTTLLARLIALVGESRVGAPIVLDSFDARRVAMAPFRIDATRDDRDRRTTPGPRHELTPVLRRFRLPIAAKVVEDRGVPVRVHTSVRTLQGGDVVRRAGPWRTSGEWWKDDAGWDRDEWDVALADGTIYRLARDRRTKHWVIEGVLD